MTTPDLLTLAARIAVDKDIESLRESAKDALEFAKFLHQYNMAVIQHSLVMQAQNRDLNGRLNSALEDLAKDAQEPLPCDVPSKP